MFLIFDVETTGFIKHHTADYSNLDNFPRIVQLAYQLHDEKGKFLQQYSQIIKPDGFEIPYAATQIHKITTERALKEGVELKDALHNFLKALEQAEIVVGHNIMTYDIRVITAEFLRAGIDTACLGKKIIIDTCTTKEVVNFCQLKGGKGGGFKHPSLGELYEKLFGKKFELAHNAAFDVQANAYVFFELLKRNIIQIPRVRTEEIDYEAPDLSELYRTEKPFHKSKTTSPQKTTTEPTETTTTSIHLAYLHNHTIYSIGHSTTKIKKLVKKAAEYQACALSITDLGYMGGVIEFYNTIKEINKEIQAKNEILVKEGKTRTPTIKPIIGCEFYLCEDIQKETPKHLNYQIPILAKNEKGYSNLCKLSSLSFIDGFYYVPRIDKKNLLAHKEGLIILSGWIYGEIPQVLFRDGPQKAEELLLWYKKHFLENFYLELNNHYLDEEKYLNDFLIKMSEKHHIPIIAAQNNYYLNPEDAEAFDTLVCIRNGEEKTKPIGKGSGKRYGLPNNQFYFQSPPEIQKAFSFYPQALHNAIALTEQIETFPVEKDIVLPKFEIPRDFIQKNPHLSELELENAYLKHLTYAGALQKYPQITEEIKTRIDFELDTIAQMGFPGYFLIVSDILNEARKKGIRIGPGRGSAAGSIVAYCIGITNVDPIHYHLLFERFLNPERVSMPDIDIDIADDQRDEVIDYIIQKYGKDRVAHIITFSSLGGKSAIRDTARTLGLDPQEINKIANAFTPLANMKISLEELTHIDDMHYEKYLSENQSIEELKKKIKNDYTQFINAHPKAKEILEQAAKIDGCYRHTGKHACGLIIAPKRLDEISPLAKDSKSGQIITQFDISVAEKAGLLKMDFLGLTTLSIITETLKYIKENKGIEVDIDRIPLNDEKTFDIFKNGYTDEIFQFESPGMKKYLQQLKPDTINDLIAMNALYRPGPMKYIDSFIKRKHGLEEIKYPLPEMEDILKETYGITVYQEQVMLLSQKLAGFTKGQADELRKAMGKKKRDVLQKMEQQFLDGCKKNGLNLNIVKKIWENWKDFASYAFNKSHSVCYALLAYQTAYLKAHFPSEFMCAVLNTKTNIDEIASVFAECNRMNIKILPPDINESMEKFNVMKNGNIRFGLSYIKNVSTNFAEELIKARKNKGKIRTIFELSERLSTKVLNKKNIENLAQAGAFDSIKDIHRAMFFIPAKDGLTLTEKLIKFAENQQKQQTIAQSLFDSAPDNRLNKYPDILPVPEWDTKTKLIKEKETLGLFISGTPLDSYPHFMKSLKGLLTIKELNERIKENSPEYENKKILILGWATHIEQKTNKRGHTFYSLTLEDKTGHIHLYINEQVAKKANLKDHLNDLKCYLISGTIEARKSFDNAEEKQLEFKVNECTTLEEYVSKRTELKISLNIKDIHLELIRDFEKMCKTNGNLSIPVTLIITDDAQKVRISTTNPLKINFDKSNFELLEKYHLEYKILLKES